MIEGLNCDLDALGRGLSAHIPGFEKLIRVEKFATGQSNPTYALYSDAGRYVLRAKPPGELLASAHMVEREYRVMRALAGSDVPVPRVFYLDEDPGNPVGRVFFVMEYLDGRIFWDPALPALVPAQRLDIYQAMNATLAALHEVDPSTVGLSDFGKPGNYFARQTGRWAKQYRASALAPNPDMLWLTDWLDEALPDDDGQIALVHGDYRLDNMIFHPERAEIIGLLDWELSTLGHPLADLAYQCMQWRLPHKSGMRGLGGLDRPALGLPIEADYIAAYLAKRQLAPIPNWPFYLVFSFFRLAAILEGVVRRAHDGNASNPQTARTYAAVIPMLAAEARQIAEKELV